MNNSLLMLAPTAPWPTNMGSRIRIYHSVCELAKLCDVTLITAVGSDNATPSNEIREICEDIRLIEVEPRSRGAAAIRSVYRWVPYRVAKFNSPVFRTAVEEALLSHDFDIVWCHFWNTVAYLQGVKASGDRKIVVDQHINDVRMWRRYCSESSNIFKRWFACLNARLIDQYQQRMVPVVTDVVSVSEYDGGQVSNRLDSKITVSVVPNGVDVSALKPPASHVSEREGRIVFVGSMDIDMNIQAVEWFVKKVYSRVRRRAEVEFYIVGRRPAERVRELESHRGVNVTGTVESVAEYYWRSQVAVVPFQYRASTKLKVPEALASGTAVVATPEGVLGIEGESGHHYLVADNADDFAKCVLDVINNTNLRRNLSAAGRKLVEERYQWSQVYRNGLLKITGQEHQPA